MKIMIGHFSHQVHRIHGFSIPERPPCIANPLQMLIVFPRLHKTDLIQNRHQESASPLEQK